MKRLLLFFVLMSAMLFAQSSNLKGALQNLEDTARTMLLMSIVVEGIIAVVFLGIAALIYLKKLKGVEKKGTAWLLAAVLLGLIGALFALGAIVGLITYLTTPVLVNGLIGG